MKLIHKSDKFVSQYCDSPGYLTDWKKSSGDKGCFVLFCGGGGKFVSEAPQKRSGIDVSSTQIQ